jgi:4a-hydroxytetrahydrobiopterin dehydratase
MNGSLPERHCQRETSQLDRHAIDELLGQVDTGWSLTDDNSGVRRIFSFKDYYRTMAFVNALAWVAHNEDHHPELSVGYNRCTVTFSTHSVGGLSENDFICAAHIDALDAGRA